MECDSVAMPTVLTVMTSPDMKAMHHPGDHQSKKRKPTADVLFRVWGLHERTGHVALYQLAAMIMAGHLHNAEATGAEVLLVAGHQQCFACAIAK